MRRRTREEDDVLGAARSLAAPIGGAALRLGDLLGVAVREFRAAAVLFEARGGPNACGSAPQHLAPGLSRLAVAAEAVGLKESNRRERSGGCFIKVKINLKGL